jgi:hypothetical protein
MTSTQSPENVPSPDNHQATSAEELTTENAGQATTAEEAMEAVAGVDGHVSESAYTPSDNEESANEDDDATSN